MEAIPQNIKQFGKKSCCFTSQSEHSGRLTQTMTLDLTSLPNRERHPFHRRKPTSAKYLNEILKEPKPQSRTPYVRKGRAFPCTGQLTQEEGPEEGIPFRILPQSGGSGLVTRGGRKPSVAVCECVCAQNEVFCSSWGNNGTFCTLVWDSVKFFAR